MILVLKIISEDTEVTWYGSAGSFGGGVLNKIFHMAPESKVVGLIGRTRLPLLQAWQACVDAGLTPIMLQYPTAKLSRTYWIDEINQAVRTIGIDILVCADADCVPQTVIPVIILDTIQPATHPAVTDSQGLAGNGRFIQMSSGTTGHRKGIYFSLPDVRNHVKAYNEILQIGADDCIISWLPLYHDMGFIATFLMPLILECRVVLIDPMDWVRQPGILWDAIDRFGGTICFMPNFGFEIMAKQPRPAPTMRRWMSCSEPTRRETMARFATATGTPADRISNCWGMAENIFAVTQADGIRTRSINGEDVVSCGRPIPGTVVKSVEGQLFVRSEYSLSHYVDGAVITDTDGFYPTGDMGEVIEGEVYLRGRQRDMINHAGRKMLLSDLDFKVAQIVPDAAGRLACLSVFDPGLATETLVVLIEDSAFWQCNRNQEQLAAIAATTGIETAKVHFVPPRFIIKTSSGKVNRRKTAEHWVKMQAFKRDIYSGQGKPNVDDARRDIAETFPALDLSKPIKAQIDSLGFVNLCIILSIHGFNRQVDAELSLNDVLETYISPEELVDGFNIVSLADGGPFRGLFEFTVKSVPSFAGKPVHFKHLCAPPAPILLSDMIFAEYFASRAPDPDVYRALLSVIADIRRASVLIVDDLVNGAWLRASLTYPRLNPDFRRDPLSDYLGVRWARYSDSHDRLAYDLIDGASIPLGAVNQAITDLSDYLGIPILRIAYGTEHPEMTAMWEIQIGANAMGVATMGDARLIDREALREPFFAALKPILDMAPTRKGAPTSSYDYADQPHWCSWIVSKASVDFILDRYDNILALGKPASIPYLRAEAERRGKQVTYRPDLHVPDEFDCVVQNGSSNQPVTDKPIYMLMDAGWLVGDRAANVVPEVLAQFPKSRLWTRAAAEQQILPALKPD